MDSDKDSVQYYLQESKKHAYDDFKTASYYLKKAEKVALKSEDEILIADVAHNYGATYYINGSYEISLQKFMEALAIYERYDHKLGISKCLMGQGLIQQGIGRNGEAIKLFQKAIVLSNDLKDIVLVSKNYLNIGISQTELNQYEEAYENFHRALKFAQKSQNIDVEYISFNRLGNIHYLKNNLDSAIYYFKIIIKDSSGANSWEKSFAFSSLSEVYLKKRNDKLAEEFGLKGYEMALKIRAKWDIERSAKILSEVYKNNNNFQAAYDYLEISQAYSDSLYNEKKVKEINFLQLTRKEAENEKLVAKNEIADQKLYNTRMFVVFVISLMLFLLVVIYQSIKNAKIKGELYKRLKEKKQDIESQKTLITEQNQILTELNQTKNKLFSILSHDLRSPLGSIKQVLSLLKEGEISTEDLKTLSEHLIVQVDGTSMMLNNILHWSMTQLDGAKINAEDIVLDTIVEESINALCLAAEKKKITINNFKPTDAIIIHADKGHAHIIINNLLANAIKYTPEEGFIEISYSEENSLDCIHILNSGSGISETKIKEILNFDQRMISEKGTSSEEGTGLGLLLVKQFLAENKGKLNIVHHPERGTEFIASFPKAK